MYLTFGLLGAAMLLTWLPNLRLGPGLRVPPWAVLFLASVAAGLASDLLRWPALIVLGAIWGMAWASSRTERLAARRAALAGAALMALGMAVHVFPGFVSPKVAEAIRLSVDSAPMTLRANFDKGAAGLILVVYCCRRVDRIADLPRVLGVGVLIGVGTAVPVVALVAIVGAVHFDPKLPEIALAWMGINLGLTCLMEEAFFRGLIQERLTHALAGHPQWRFLPIAAASVLFGLVHFGGGPILIISAALAGVGYGLAYSIAGGRIEAAVIAHFALNAIHFFGFTYPYAAR